MAKHPTSKLKGQRQKAKKRYAKAREDAQLFGVIPTTPDGALRPEAVDPATQTQQQFPKLIEGAVRNGWATPDEIKPKLVDEMIRPFFEREVRTDKDGNQFTVPPDRHLLKENFKALAMVDKHQWERDREERGEGKDDEKGPGVQVNIVNQNTINLDPYEAHKRLVAEVQRDEVEERLEHEQKMVQEEVRDQPGIPGSSGQHLGQASNGEART